MKIVKLPDDAGLLIKGFSKTIKKEAKEQKGGFLGMLIDASLLGNLLGSKGVKQKKHTVKV